MEISRFFSTFGRMKQIRFHFSLDFPLDFFDFLRQDFRSPPVRSRFWKNNILKALRFCWFSPCSAKYYWFCAENIQKMLWVLDFQNIKNLTDKKDTWRSFRQVPFFFYLFAFFRLLPFGRPYHIPALVICVAKTSPPESERLNAVPIIIICGASANITLFCENRTFSFPLCVWREKRV